MVMGIVLSGGEMQCMLQAVRGEAISGKRDPGETQTLVSFEGSLSPSTAISRLGATKVSS